MNADDLQILISNMNPAERKYFSQFAFKGLSKEKQNAELKIFKKLSAAGNKKEKLQDADAKNRFVLAEEILDNQLQFHEKRFTDYGFMKRITQYRLLYEKGLQQEAIKRLVKLIEKTKIHEDYQGLMKAQYQLINWYMADKDKTVLMENAVSEYALYTESQHIQSQYSHLRFNVAVMVNKAGGARYMTKDMIEHFTDIINHPLLKDPSGATTYRTRNDYHFIHMNYQLALGNLPEAIKYSEKLLLMLKAHPLFLDSLQREYMLTLNNHLTWCLRASEYDAFEVQIEELRKLEKTVPPMDWGWWFIAYYNLLFNYYLTKNTFHEAVPLLRSLESNLHKAEKLLNPSLLIPLYLNAGISYFMLKNHKHSMLLANKAILRLPVTKSYGFHFTCYLLMIMNQYDSGNKTALPGMKRQIANRYDLEKQYPIVDSINNFVEEVAVAQKRSEQIVAFHRLTEVIKGLKETDAAFVVIINSMFMDWLDDNIKLLE